MKKVNVFISYSHDDYEYLSDLKQYINEKNCPNIQIWDDGKISAGIEWDEAIKKHLEASHIVLLFISQYFLNSTYIDKIELKIALDKHEQKKCRVIPIFVRSCLLDDYPHITKLQGLPAGMKFLNTMGKEIDTHYMQIQKEINEIANEVLTEINLQESINQNNPKAEIIHEIRNKRKIFLSIPDSEEGKLRRKKFLYSVAGKINYEGWPYEIVPGIKDIEELEKKSEGEKKKFIAALLSESLYAIHILAIEDELAEGFDKIQYELSKDYSERKAKEYYEVLSEEYGVEFSFFKNILWVLNPIIIENLDKELCMNPLVSGSDEECVFQIIGDLDIEKEKMLDILMHDFSPDKKVFMFYDFSKDHDSKLRIKLKSKIEENKNLVVKYSLPNATLEEDKEDLGKCEGACIFYGASDPKWFIMRQSILIDAGFTQSKAVCVDEPEIDTKIERDVSNNAFTVIKGMSELEIKLKSFLQKLKIRI